MLIIDPYETTYGSLINKENVSKELTKFLITNTDSNLNYEIVETQNCKLIYVTGYNKDEKDLLVWSYPLIFKNVKNQMVIGVDLRKYVKSIQEQPLNLEDIFKDRSSCEFLINTSIIMSDFLENNFSNYKKIYNNITTSYAMFISFIVNLVVSLDPVEKNYVELASMYFSNIMLLPKESNLSEYIDPITARITNSKTSLPNIKRTVDSVISRLRDVDITYDIYGLIELIKTVLPTEKAELITEGVLINSVSNLWYGPGSNEIIIIGLENMAVWTSLLYTCVSDMTYKRSKLSTIFDKFSKNINNQEVIKCLDIVMKERKMKS